MIAKRSAYQVKMYCVWLFLKLTSAGRPIGIPTASLSYAVRRSGACNFVSHSECKPPYEPYPWSLLPRPGRFLYTSPFAQHLGSRTRPAQACYLA